MQHNSKLINGVFTKAQAQRILFSLIQYKINFHELESFSSEIRFGYDKSRSMQRVEELSKEKVELAKLFASMLDSDTIKINCNIEIELPYHIKNPA